VYAPAMRRYVAAILSSAGGPRDPDTAADVVQAYLATCLEKGWLQRDGDEIRCFRAYLQVQLRRFTLAWLRDQGAARRSPPNRPTDVGLETVAAVAADVGGALDAALVEAAVAQAHARLRRGNETYAEIVADLLRTHGEGSPDLAERIGHSRADLPVLRHRAKRRFAVLLASELRATVREDEAYEALLRCVEPYLP
jgi:DNA-directed RNA polymerase specialized sigma24 family protein